MALFLHHGQCCCKLAEMSPPVEVNTPQQVMESITCVLICKITSCKTERAQIPKVIPNEILVPPTCTEVWSFEKATLLQAC